MTLPVQTSPTEDVLPQMMGEFFPVDVWQSHMNRLFYGLRGLHVREFYQTFAAADYRLAYALATEYYKRACKRDKADDQDTSSLHTEASSSRAGHTLTIHEWGCGNGNLAACFLDCIKNLDKSGTIYPRIQYVLVDSVESVLASARANPDLARHEGRYTILQADVTDLQSWKDGSVDRIFCNELWSELPTKLLLRKGGEVMEEHLRPNLKESRLADITDWAGFVQAFDQGDGEALKKFPSTLEDIVWEREYHKVEGKTLPFRKLVTEFLRQIDEEILIPVNVGAAATIKEAKRLLAPDAIGFSSFDAGTLDRDVLNDAEKPCYGLHGGQFSFLLNFVLLEEVAAHVGGHDVIVEPQKEFVGRSLGTNVMSLMDLLASHPNLPKGGQWEIDSLTLKTLQVMNRSYVSPYQRPIEFPLAPDTPPDQRLELEALLTSLKADGVPDTIAYLTEEDISKAMAALEELGYDREGIRAMLRVPPQFVDYFHFTFAP